MPLFTQEKCLAFPAFWDNAGHGWGRERVLWGWHLRGFSPPGCGAGGTLGRYLLPLEQREVLSSLSPQGVWTAFDQMQAQGTSEPRGA